MIKEEAQNKLAWKSTHRYYGYDGGIRNMRCVADNVLKGQTVPYESNQELLKPLAEQLARAPADGRWPVLGQDDFVAPETKPPKFATRAPYHVLFPNQLQYILDYNLAVGFALGYRAKELEGEPKETEKKAGSDEELSGGDNRLRQEACTEEGNTWRKRPRADYDNDTGSTADMVRTPVGRGQRAQQGPGAPSGVKRWRYNIDPDRLYRMNEEERKRELHERDARDRRSRN